MADPHRVLAPLVEPQLPPSAATLAAAREPALQEWLLGPALVLLLAVGLWRWHRGAAARTLRRIERQCANRDVILLAGALARWQTRYWTGAPEDWRQALERLRFGAPGEASAQAQAALQALCAQARAALAAKGAR